MPELNPLTNEQIFLKKIAENTGSDYNTGDVSEINPLTIDQILLKEIAANTAGQSGDITELEGKVADNAEAIEAMVNVNGSCNVLPLNISYMKSANTVGTWNNNVYTFDNVSFTVNADNIVVNGTPSNNIDFFISSLDHLKTGVKYTCSAGNNNVSIGTVLVNIPSGGPNTNPDAPKFDFTYNGNQPYVRIIVMANTQVNNEVFKPMIYDARLNPTGYVPYAMTNRELTDNAVKLSNVTPQQISEPTISLQLGGVLKYGRLAVVQLRFATTSNTPTSGVLYAGLPKPYLFNNLTYDAVFLTSNNGKASIDAQGTLYYGDITAGNSIIVTGTYIWSEAGY